MRVIVGRVGRPHGIRGEVVIGVRTDEPDLRFAVGATLDVTPTLAAPEARPEPAESQRGRGGRGGRGDLGGKVSPQDRGARGARGDGESPRERGSRGGLGGKASPQDRGDPGGSPPGETPPPRDSTAHLTVASARWHSGQLLVAFAGITDRTAAGELTGSWLSVDSSLLPETSDPDEFRDYELIGLSVRTTGGLQVGVVDDVLHHGQDLLVVRRPQDDECLVPFVKAIVPEVDVAGGVLVIDPPPGLLDPAQAEE